MIEVRALSKLSENGQKCVNVELQNESLYHWRVDMPAASLPADAPVPRGMSANLDTRSGMKRTIVRQTGHASISFPAVI